MQVGRRVDLHEKLDGEKEQPYPSHWAIKKPQLRNHCSRPESVPLHLGMDSSDAYIGMVLVRMPTAMPPMKRPTISMTMVAAPHCKAEPSTDTRAPMRTVFLRPSLGCQNTP
jgi:hypothetical protein